MGLTDFWSRKRFITGSNTGTYDDANPDFNGGESGDEGYIEEIPKSSKITSGLWRVLKLQTVFYQLQKFAVHKNEDRATASDLGVSTEPSASDLKFPVVQQLPAIGVIDSDFTIDWEEADGLLRDNVKFAKLTLDITGKRIVYQLNADDEIIKLIIARTTTTSTQNYYVDGNGGSDVLGNGSIIKPYKTVQWAAHKARQYSYDNNKPVTISVFGGSYTVVDVETINTETVVGNLWIYGGWNFYPGSNITFNSVAGHYLFTDSSVDLPAFQSIGNMVVEGSLVLTSTNGGVIQHTETNFTLNFEWLRSTTFREFINQDRVGNDGVFITLKNGIAVMTNNNTSCVYAANRPAIAATDCYFYNTTNTTVPNIDFNSAGVDLFGVFCVFNRCHFGADSGEVGQIRVGRSVRILDILDCEFFGSTTSTRDCIRLESNSLNLSSNSPVRINRNYVVRRSTIGTPPVVINFIFCSQSASIIAEGNNCHAARLSCGAGATLTTLSIDNTAYPVAVVSPSSSEPATLASSTDNNWSPAYNIWI